MQKASGAGEQPTPNIPLAALAGTMVEPCRSEVGDARGSVGASGVGGAGGPDGLKGNSGAGLQVLLQQARSLPDQEHRCLAALLA